MKKLLLMGMIAGGLSSCTVSHTIMVTNNAVGSKVGMIKKSAFSKDVDLSLESACKKGKITKVGTVEMKMKFFILPSYKIVVTGE